MSNVPRRFAAGRRIATCVLAMLCASVLPVVNPVEAVSSLRLTWTTATLASGSSTPLDSLVSTNVTGRRSWLVRGNCTRVGTNVVALTNGRCSVRITIRLGRTRNFVRFRTLRILSPMTEAAPPGSPGSTLSPEPAVWYPSGVPDQYSDRWVVPIGSYVRGKDVFPLLNTLPAADQAGCEQATKVTQGLIILSFGRQIEGGTTGFGLSLSYDDIAQVARAWAMGLARCARGPWELALGTSNSGGLTLHNGYTGGRRWAELVAAVRAIADPRVIVSGANDLEPGWGPAGQARAWVDGFVRTTNAIRLWNFGSADGCPTTATKFVCGNNWTIDDVIWVSAQAGPNLVVVPQIHTKTGSQARQWARIASRAKSLGITMKFGGMSVQTAACKQVKGGCPTTGVSAWNGWQQLRTALDALDDVRGTPLGAPIDIRWGWGGPFFRPPPTTTTTTTTTTTSTTSTSTTTSSVAPPTP